MVMDGVSKSNVNQQCPTQVALSQLSIAPSYSNLTQNSAFLCLFFNMRSAVNFQQITFDRENIFIVRREKLKKMEHLSVSMHAQNKQVFSLN